VESDYLEAALPERFIILGQRLRPFSVGHLMLLRRVGNAFVLQTAPGIEDLLSGVLICCQTYEEACESLQDPGLPARLRKWARKLGPFNITLKTEEFARYVRLGSTWPELHDLDDDDRRAPGAPFIQRVRIVLQAKLGLSPSEALDYPWGLAQHDYFAFWELEERCRILNAEEKALAADETGLLAQCDAFLKTDEFAQWLAAHTPAVDATPEMA
jgi:hypothetical protein